MIILSNKISNLKFSIKPIVFNDYPAFGPGVVMILELVEKTNSLSETYSKMGLSSSKGWKIVKRAEEDLGFPLIESVAGGRGGGYSSLTKEGKDILDRYHGFTGELDKAAREIFKKHFKV